MQITTNCIINGMPEAVYHNDPTPLACEGFKEYTSLSSSTLKTLMEKTEIEARATINRFNPKSDKKSSKSIDLGSMGHDYVLLGGSSLYEIAPVQEFRTNDAKQMRDDIIARGKIPLNLSTQHIVEDLKTMKTRLFEQIAEHQDYPGILLQGKPEQSAFAFDGEIWNRARFDWLDSAYENLVVDYKTTGLSFEQWEKNELWGDKFYQKVHYSRVAEILRKESSPDSRPFRFIYVVQQTFAPFLMEIYEIDASFDFEIMDRYNLGRKKFINCLKTGIWRGRPPYTKHSTPPPWVTMKWENDKLTEEAIALREKEAAQQPVEQQSTYMAG